MYVRVLYCEEKKELNGSCVFVVFFKSNSIYLKVNNCVITLGWIPFCSQQQVFLWAITQSSNKLRILTGLGYGNPNKNSGLLCLQFYGN